MNRIISGRILNRGLIYLSYWILRDFSIYFRLERLVSTEWRWAVWRGDRMDLHVHHESGMH